MKMLKAIAAIIFTAALSCAAQAQTAPNLTFGEVLTPAQWQALFAGKQDFLGAAPILITGGTMTGPLVTQESSASGAGLNLPPGAAPTSPNNGDLWSTPAGFFGQVNGATVGPFAQAVSRGFTAASPIVASFPGGGVVNYSCGTCGVTGSPLSQFASTTSAQLAGVISDETGTGSLVFGTSPSLVTPNLGTPSAAILTHATGLPVSTGISGLGTGIPAALAANIGTAGAPALFSGALGTPTATSIAIGGATIGSNALAVTGTSALGATVSNGSFSSTGADANFNAGGNRAFMDFSGGNARIGSLNGGGSGVGLSIIVNNSTQIAFPSSGGMTFTAPVAETGAASGTCTNGWAENSAHQLILVACPGATASIQVGVTTVTSSAGSNRLHTSGTVSGGTGLLSEVPITSDSSGNLAAVNSLAGSVIATKAQQIAGTSAVNVVTPSVQQNHPSAAKAWVNFSGSGTNGAQTINASFNVSGVSRAAAGTYIISFTTPFTSTSYSCVGSQMATGSLTTNGWVQLPTAAAGSIQASFVTISSGSLVVYDPNQGSVVCFGTQ